MATPHPTRDRILDALQTVLIEHGERAATIEAVAQGAGVSKGGLLYHFASKEAMTDGLLDRFRAAVAADIVTMSTSPAGPVDSFIRSSVSTLGDFDRTFVAVSRLAQGSHPEAREALQAAQAAWLSSIQEEVSDPDVARAITLIGDGIYYNSSMGAAVPNPAELDALMRIISSLIANSR